MADDFDDLDIHLEESASHDSGRAPAIYVSPEVWAGILAHSDEDLSNELGGVLLGSAAASDAGAVVVVIEASLRALHTDASRGRVTFTHDTWAQICEARDRDHPDRQIVGWYHTHPGFGLFLSEYDLFIHRSFFREPSQVALVVDPRAGTSGFFVWAGDGLTGPLDARVIDVEGRAQAPVADAARPIAEPVPEPVPQGLAWPRWALAACLALVLILQVLILRGLREPAAPAAAAPGAADLAPLKREITRLREELKQRPAPIPPRAAVAERPPEPPEGTYVVQPGDSLWSIAEEFYGDGAKWRAIGALNGIGPEQLEPGMVLRTPRGEVPDGR